MSGYRRRRFSKAPSKKKKTVQDVRKKWKSVKGSHLGMHYTFPLTSLSPEEWESHKEELTFKPESSFASRNPFAKPPDPLRIWGESGGYAIVPGPYGIEWFGEPFQDDQQAGVPIDVNWHPDFKLWGEKDSFNQQKVVDIVLDHWDTKQAVPRGIQFEAPTSGGKTFMASYLISKFKVKTLVIVPAEQILQQWPDELQKFIPGCKVGIMQGRKKCEYENVDVTVAMIHSLVRCKYPEEAFKDFGFVIIDEAHLMPTKSFIKVLSIVGNIRRKLGVTATFDRNDKMDRVLYPSVGPLIYRAPKDTEASRKTKLQPILYQGGLQRYKRKPDDWDYVQTMSLACSDPYRTDALYTKVIKEQFEKGRRVAIIGERTDLLGELHARAKADFPDLKLFHLHQKVPKKQRKTLNNSVYDGVFAGYRIFGTGSNLTYLDTIVFVTSCSSIEQAAGRLRSQCNLVKRQDLLILDWVDCFVYFEGQFDRRCKVYRKKKFIMMPPKIIKATHQEIVARHKQNPACAGLSLDFLVKKADMDAKEASAAASCSSSSGSNKRKREKINFDDVNLVEL